MSTILNITGSGIYSLGLGGDFKKTSCEVGLQLIGTVAGNFSIMRKEAGEPSSSLTYYTKYSDGTNANTALVASADVSVPSTGAEILVSASITTPGTVNVYYEHVANL